MEELTKDNIYSAFVRMKKLLDEAINIPKFIPHCRCTEAEIEYLKSQGSKGKKIDG